MNNKSMPNASILKDINHFKAALLTLPTYWDGRESIIELKIADYNWKQMEWWAFYFEFKARRHLQDFCQFPGDRYDNRVEFDLKTSINWDFKAKAIKSDEHKVILNDKLAMQKSVQEHGYHGEIIALCDVEYNDNDRSFQKWHSELKGGKSDYEKRKVKESPDSFSRYRKTSAELIEIYYVVFGKEELDLLDEMKQGKNSNGKPRPLKYMLDMDEINNFYHERQKFTQI